MIRIFWAAVTLLLALAVLIQMPSVQNAAVQRLLGSLTGGMKGHLTVGRLQMLPFRTVVVKDILLLDDNPHVCDMFDTQDTVVFAKEAVVTLSLKELLGGEGITISKVSLSDAVINMVLEGNHQNNFKRLLSKGNPHPMEDKGDVFYVGKIKARNVRYRMHNVNGEHDREMESINWADLDATVQDLDAHALHLCNACVYGTLDRAEITEKSGFSGTLTGVSTEIRSGNVQIRNINLEDEWSDLHLDRFSMTYANGRSFRDFTHKVTLEGSVSGSTVGLRTVGYFVPALYGRDLTLDVHSAQFGGPVDTMSISSLVLDGPGSTHASLAASWKGLLESRPVLSADIRKLNFTTAGISEVMSGLGMKMDLGKYAPGESFSFRGKASGPGNSLSVDGALTSTAGSAEAHMKVRDLMDSSKPVQVGGSLGTDDLDIGKLIGADMVHQCTLHGYVSASLGKTPSFKVDTLTVKRLNILGYDYTGLAAAGKFSGSSFDGRVICSDPNLNFMFQGLFNLSKKTSNAAYKFFFNLGYADLNALNIDRRGTSKASLSVNANFKRIKKKDIIGDINVKGIRLENDEGMHELGNMAISSHTVDEINRIGFTSSFAEGAYVGTKSVTSVVDAILETTLRKQLPALAGKAREWKGDNYRLSLKFTDMRDLLSFALPGLYVAEGSSLKATVTSEGRFTADMTSQRLAYGDKYLKDIRLSIPDAADTILLKTSELSIGGLRLKDGRIKLHAADDHLDLLGGFRNDGDSYGDLHMTADFERGRGDSLTVDLRALPSDFSARGEKWHVHQSRILYSKGGLKVDSLGLSNRSQGIFARGGWSRTGTDTLRAEVGSIDIGSITRLIGKDISLTGRLTGTADICSSGGQTGLRMDARCDSTYISGVSAGDIMMKTGWDDEDKSLDFRVFNLMGTESALDASGSYFPAEKKVNARLKLDGLDLGYARDFVSSFLSDIGGKIDGEVTLAGPFSNMSVYSRGVRLDNAMIRIGYTDVQYFLDGPLHITDSGIVFDDIAISDGLRGTGTVGGGVPFEHLRNIRSDIRIRARQMKMYAAGEDSDAVVYGDITGSGNISLAGPLNGLLLDVDARTDGTGNIHIPLKNFSGAGSTSLLTFREPEEKVKEDPYEAMMRSGAAKQKGKSHFDMKLKVSVQPEIECSIELDKESGNVLKGRGYGSIAMDVLHDRPFAINGDYSLNSGDFHFNALGIAKRKFSITSGSSIKFGGDLMDSDLDITATYTTKTSLTNLISDTTSVSSRRTVECGLSMTEKLSNPKLGFSIDIPDLDPTTKSLVETSLNTDDKIQKQFLALLVTGNFLPGDESGIVNNSSLLFSNVSEIMAGQLNSILERLGIPLDLGLKYQPSEGGTDIFDVAVSTQLFNNRVTVNGSVGNRQYGTTGSTEDVAGDLDIEVKLDKAGAVRMSAFSHSADQYTNYLDNTQRNGVGIGYQKEFNSFRELLRSKRRAAPETAARKAPADTTAARPRERVSRRCVIEIGNDD